ncbi:MAG: acyl-CoA desaturase [Nocardiaceae bacterium]|nr:acyl-CoA desaturase [Nocardiaceae bacterium]
MTPTLKAPVSLGGAINPPKPSPVAHLTAADIEALGKELDAIRDEVLSTRGERDAKYIRSVITNNRRLELAARGVLTFSLFPPAWLLGTAMLSVAKIVDNMEISHNVMHGQWDWMRDPKIHSSTWEWDNVNPSELWKHTHNEVHHTWTNVVGKDKDLGYGVLRMDEAQKWKPFYLGGPIYNTLMLLLFEYAVAIQDAELGNKKLDPKERSRRLTLIRNKIAKQGAKDYLLYPALTGPSFIPTLFANLTANLVRNIWTHSIIFCGHFPADVQTYEYKTIVNETRGDWYIRQMMGAANIDGGPVMNYMSGNLSFQIEHHLWPDLPSNRYVEVAPKVREICERYGIPYVSGPLPKQVYEAWAKVVRLSFPNNFWADTKQTITNMPNRMFKRAGRVAGKVIPFPTPLRQRLAA